MRVYNPSIKYDGIILRKLPTSSPYTRNGRPSNDGNNHCPENIDEQEFIGLNRDMTSMLVPFDLLSLMHSAAAMR